MFELFSLSDLSRDLDWYNYEGLLKIEFLYDQLISALKDIKDIESKHLKSRMTYQVGMEYYWINNITKRDKYFIIAQKMLNELIKTNQSFGEAYVELGSF